MKKSEIEIINEIISKADIDTDLYNVTSSQRRWYLAYLKAGFSIDESLQTMCYAMIMAVKIKKDNP